MALPPHRPPGLGSPQPSCHVQLLARCLGPSQVGLNCPLVPHGAPVPHHPHSAGWARRCLLSSLSFLVWSIGSTCPERPSGGRAVAVWLGPTAVSGSRDDPGCPHVIAVCPPHAASFPGTGPEPGDTLTPVPRILPPRDQGCPPALTTPGRAIGVGVPRGGSGAGISPQLCWPPEPATPASLLSGEGGKT